MNKLIILILLIIGFSSNAQKIKFEYDNAGNQIVRKICPGCLDKNSNENPKEIEDLTPEDLKKFFPEDVISYYPNPVKEQLYIKWELINGNKVSEIQLYSLNGQLLKSISKLEGTNNQTLFLQNYPQGIYNLLLIYTDGDQKAIKIIKE